MKDLLSGLFALIKSDLAAKALPPLITFLTGISTDLSVVNRVAQLALLEKNLLEALPAIEKDVIAYLMTELSSEAGKLAAELQARTQAAVAAAPPPTAG